jgi:hypothetical protein
MKGTRLVISPRDEGNVAREPVELRDDDRRIAIIVILDALRRRERFLQFRSAGERVALGAFNLHEGLDDVEALRLGEAADGLALRFKPESGFALLLRPLPPTRCTSGKGVSRSRLPWLARYDLRGIQKCRRGNHEDQAMMTRATRETKLVIEYIRVSTQQMRWGYLSLVLALALSVLGHPARAEPPRHRVASQMWEYPHYSPNIPEHRERCVAGRL